MMNAALAREPLRLFGRPVLILPEAQSGCGSRQDALEEKIRREGWRRCLSALESWQANPQDLRDEELAPPTTIASWRARRIALEGLDRPKSPAPSGTLPSGDGGIVFEWRLGEEHRVLQIDASGAAEDILFRGDRIVSRRGLLTQPVVQYALYA